jgi:hypothetical protein
MVSLKHLVASGTYQHEHPVLGSSVDQIVYPDRKIPLSRSQSGREIDITSPLDV